MHTLGFGNEHIVSVDPNDETTVIKEPVEMALEEPDELFRTQYYLTKVMHALYPQNVPDIHRESINSQNQTTQKVDRKRLTPDFQTMMDEKNRKLVHGKTVETSYEDRAGEHQKEMRKNPEYNRLCTEWRRLRVGFDSDPMNFAYDVEGNLIYLDTFSSLLINDDEGMDLLQKMIVEVVPSNDRNQIQKYLERYKQLSQIRAKRLS